MNDATVDDLLLQAVRQSKVARVKDSVRAVFGAIRATRARAWTQEGNVD